MYAVAVSYRCTLSLYAVRCTLYRWYVYIMIGYNPLMGGEDSGGSSGWRPSRRGPAAGGG